MLLKSSLCFIIILYRAYYVEGQVFSWRNPALRHGFQKAIDYCSILHDLNIDWKIPNMLWILGKSQCIVSSRDKWEFLQFSIGPCRSLAQPQWQANRMLLGPFQEPVKQSIPPSNSFRQLKQTLTVYFSNKLRASKTQTMGLLPGNHPNIVIGSPVLYQYHDEPSRDVVSHQTKMEETLLMIQTWLY